MKKIIRVFPGGQWIDEEEYDEDKHSYLGDVFLYYHVDYSFTDSQVSQLVNEYLSDMFFDD